MAPKKRSTAWEFYEKVNGTVAKCTICKNDVSYHGSTGNLMSHLRRKHHQFLTLYSMTESLESAAARDPEPITIPPTASSTGLQRPTCTSSIFNSPRPTTSTASTSNQEPGSSTSASSAVAPVRNNQLTITDTMRLKELPASKTKLIDNLLVDAIAEGYIAFRFVENKNFVKFVRALDPRYKLPSRKTFSNKLVNERYNEIRNQVVLKLGTAKNVALTADMWTSCNTQGFLSVTAHFVEENTLHSAVLCTKIVHDRHTAENIANHIRQVAHEWSITSKTFVLVTDNASTMVDVARRLSLKHVGCAAHTLNLVVSDVYENVELAELNELRQKCRKIVSFFKSSQNATSKLAQCQEQLNKKRLKIKQEVSTRWNSTFIMMGRFVEIKDELIMTLSYVNCKESLDANEWDILSDCVQLLEPLNELTEEISGEKYCTASIVIPLVRGCQNSVRLARPKTPMGHDLQQCLLNAMNERMTPYEDNIGTFAKATVLDPRFKNLGFGRAENASKTVAALTKELEDVQREQQMVGAADNNVEDGTVVASGAIEREEAIHNKKKKKLWSLFLDNSKRKDSVAAGQNSSSVKEDVQTYLSKPLIDIENDKISPFSYWKKYEETTPILADAANKYLCVPATSVPSERVFSKAGLILRDARNRLSAKSVDKQIFISANQKFMPL